MRLGEIDLRMLYRLWKSNLGPFKCFFRSTPFVSLQTYDDFELMENYASKCSEELLNMVLGNCVEHNFLIVDLPFDDILNLALAVNNQYDIKPILNINLLFHPFGVVGDKSNISKMINCGLKLKKINPKKFIMLLPYDRYDDNLKAKNINDKLNNQYAIGDDELPYPVMLRELGYDKVVILTEHKVKEDLGEYANFISKDISVEIIRMML